MAAGVESAPNSRVSSAALKSALDRRFQALTNTMDSIQGLSAWCIENKKQHGVIVRHWLKWLRRSEAPHRLNLFYLANDVIQNCKRKNAVAYRDSFLEVLPEAVLLVRESNLRRSMERIFTIWTERSVYPDEFLSELRAILARKDPPAPVVSSKSSLKAKIVAEFIPQTFRQQLYAYQRSLEEEELKEKQLAALRVDVCSSEALRRLKDKAGGKKFSKDFEEGSRKLQEFVSFLEQQAQAGQPLMEALNNADIFYATQYKEVQVVANAYKSFASRVSNLKSKLDALKSGLPNPDSPMPSPFEDAPSPTGSDSPFSGIDEGEAQSLVKATGPKDPSSFVTPSGFGEGDNRDVEDMELSEDEETEAPSIIVEQHVEKAESSVPVNPSTGSVTDDSSPKPAVTQCSPSASAPAPSMPVNLAGVDLAKISSILSGLTNVMKGAAVSPVARQPATSTVMDPLVKVSAPGDSQRANVSTQGLISALSKVQGQGGHPQGASSPGTSTKVPTSHHSNLLSTSQEDNSYSDMVLSSSIPDESSRGLFSFNLGRDRVKRQRETPEQPPVETRSSSLEAKIHKFLQGNPGFNSFDFGKPVMGSMEGERTDSPLQNMENTEGTPLRDEAGGTPTQDEVTDGLGEVGHAQRSIVKLNGTLRPVDTESQQHIETWVSSSVKGTPIDNMGHNYHVGLDAEQGCWNSEGNPEGQNNPNLHFPETSNKISQKEQACVKESKLSLHMPSSSFFSSPLPPIPKPPPPPLTILSRPSTVVGNNSLPIDCPSAVQLSRAEDKTPVNNLSAVSDASPRMPSYTRFNNASCSVRLPPPGWVRNSERSPHPQHHRPQRPTLDYHKPDLHTATQFVPRHPRFATHDPHVHPEAPLYRPPFSGGPRIRPRGTPFYQPNRPYPPPRY